MPETYQQLLDATIQHLQELKNRGARFVDVAPETLAALAQPSRAPAVSRPVAPRVDNTRPQPGNEIDPPISPPVKPTPPLSSSLSPAERQSKEQAMADLRARALVCVKCA